MNDLPQRVSTLERDLSAARADVAAIKAEMPHLARAADAEAIKAQLNHLATKNDVTKGFNRLLVALAAAVLMLLFRSQILEFFKLAP